MFNKESMKGTKYYKYSEEDGYIKVVRIKRPRDYFVVAEVESTGETEKIPYEELKKDYVLLTPDGYISFAIVNLSGSAKDVIVIMHRKEDLDGTANIPYAICRQYMDDVFTNMTSERNHFIGVSISKDTCPANIDFKQTMVCNGVTYQATVAVYLDDSLEKILSFVDVKKYDAVLNQIDYQIKEAGKQTQIVGSCSTLRQLMSDNNFMYDFYRAFNVMQVPFLLNPESAISEEGTFNDISVSLYLEHALRANFAKTYVTKFSKEINLRKIQKDFILIADMMSNLYIVAYDRDEDYIEKSYQMQTPKEIVAANKQKLFKALASGWSLGFGTPKI